jgi:hypothetical protein
MTVSNNALINQFNVDIMTHFEPHLTDVGRTNLSLVSKQFAMLIDKLTLRQWNLIKERPCLKFGVQIMEKIERKIAEKRERQTGPIGPTQSAILLFKKLITKMDPTFPTRHRGEFVCCTEIRLRSIYKRVGYKGTWHPNEGGGTVRRIRRGGRKALGVELSPEDVERILENQQKTLENKKT